MAVTVESLTHKDIDATASRSRRVWWASAVFLSVLVVMLSSLVLWNQIMRRPYDYPQHVSWASNLDEGEFSLGGVELPGVNIPHYLYHVFVYGLARLVGLDFQQSALTVSLLANVALALTVHSLLYRVLPQQDRLRTGLAAALLALIVLLVGPLYFLTWRRNNLYLGYLAPTVYHSPTLTLVRPFALLLFVCAVKAVAFPAEGRSWRSVAIAALLTVLATYAKPNYTLCLLPVMGGLLVLHWLGRQPVNWRLILGGIIVPGVVVLGLQYLFMFQTNGVNRLVFSPLSVARLYDSNLLFIFLKPALSLIFPAAIAALYYQRATRDTALMLAWLVMAVALGYTYLLAEAQNPEFGNFYWGSQVALFILFVFSVRFFVQQVLGPDSRRAIWRSTLCAGALALHFAAGLVWYLTEALLEQPQW